MTIPNTPNVGGKYNLLQAQRFYNSLYPEEQHNAGGDCMNPKCDYVFTPQDVQDIERHSGWFTCPKCGTTYNYLDDKAKTPGGWTRSGLTMTEMGSIGEQVIVRMGNIPNVGNVIQWFGETSYKYPVDFQIGPYGVECKTIHSEASPRFKLTGGGARTRQDAIQEAVNFCQQHDLTPAMVGVRLNFYTDKADIFFRQGLADTWIGSANMPHIATVDFSDLNPFKNPEDVPTPNELPEDDNDGIPF